MKIHLGRDSLIFIVIILQRLREDQILQSQLLHYFHQELLELQQEEQLVEHPQLQLQLQQPQALAVDLPHLAAVDLAMAAEAADIND